MDDVRAQAGRVRQPGELRVATWNVAAVNNNPFEYWITHPDPEYDRLMEAVQQFIDAPGAADVRVGEIDQLVAVQRRTNLQQQHTARSATS